MPSKRRKNQPTDDRNNLSETSPAPPPVPAPPAPSRAAALPSHTSTGWTVALFFLFSVLSFACRKSHNSDAAFIFLVFAGLLVFSRFLNLRNAGLILLLIALGWFLTATSIGNYHNFQYAFSFFNNFNLSHPIFYFALGFGLLLAFWRYLPPLDATMDISRLWARIWFWVILIAAAFLRLYDVHHAVGQYWDDPALCIVDPRLMLENHWFPMFMPFASREPFYSYFLAGLWALMPDAHAIFIQRLGSALIDLTAVWFLYLLGKEVGGRITGLVAAALGAISKPMIIQTLLGMTGVTTPMAVALILLMTFRLFKRPDWNHFIKWGLALGFMPYNYTPIRPWILFLAVVVFLWIWLYQEKAKPGKWEFRLGAGTLLIWCYLFFLKNNFVSHQNPVIAFLDRTWIGIVVAVVLWFLFIKAYSEAGEHPDGKPPLMARWFFGLFLAALVIYPLASQPGTAGRLSYISIFHDNKTTELHFQFGTFAILFKKIWFTLQTMFMRGQDRGDMSVYQWDAFLEYHFIPIFALGLAAFLAQPTWTRLFLVLGGFVGISAHYLSSDPHSAKMTGGVVPLAVLSGLAVQQICSAWTSISSHRRWIGFFLGTVLAGYFAWAVWASFDRVWVQYTNHERADKTISRQVEKDTPQNRVYVALYPNWVSSQTQSLMNQGRELFLLKENNVIFVREGEAPKDVVVLMSYNDVKLRSMINEQFKNVSWELIPAGAADPGALPTGRRVMIPASEIPDEPGKLIYFQRVPSDYWIRDYYAGIYIIGDGIFEYEEAVPTPYDPIPPGKSSRVMRLKGTFNLPTAGQITFKMKTANYVILRVDGKKVFKLNPRKVLRLKSKTVGLAAGDHSVEYFNFMQVEQRVPPISMTTDGMPEKTMGATITNSFSTSPGVPVFKY